MPQRFWFIVLEIIQVPGIDTESIMMKKCRTVPISHIETNILKVVSVNRE